MSRRALLSPEQRIRLFGIPVDQAEMARHYVLSAEDLALVRAKRRVSNAGAPGENAPGFEQRMAAAAIAPSDRAHDRGPAGVRGLQALMTEHSRRR
jgi:hypothetical protein